MFVAQGATHDPSSLLPIALVVITGTVVFWRTLIKVVIIGVILLVVLGLSDILHVLH
jgi:hypothetical protein